MKYLMIVVQILLMSPPICAQKLKSIAQQKPKIELTYSLSLIRLIANPEKYDGKLVYLYGYMHLEFEGDALYFHKEDFDKNLHFNSVQLSFSNSSNLALRSYSNRISVPSGSLQELNNKYVRVFGRFKACEGCGIRSGILTQISEIDEQAYPQN